jgi:hypothetical protein
MPYFAADSRAAAVPQLGFPITPRSDSFKNPIKKPRPAMPGRGLPIDSKFDNEGVAA